MLIGGEQDACEAMRLMLCRLGHAVTVARNLVHVRHALAAGSPVDSAFVCGVNRSVVQLVRSESRKAVHVIAVVADTDGPQAERAWSCGVNDILQSGAGAAQVKARLSSVDLTSGWVSTVSSELGEFESDVWSRSSSLTRFMSLVRSQYRELFGRKMLASPVVDVPPLGHAAEVRLALVSDDVGLVIGVGVTAEAVPEFCQVLFSEAVGVEVVADAVRELANTAGGSLRRYAASDGQAFALGVPVDTDVSPSHRGTRAWRVASGELELFIWIRTRQHVPCRLPATMLQAGMVMRRPIRSSSGVALIAAGTVLTDHAIGRVLDSLGPQTLVEVSQAT